MLQIGFLCTPERLEILSDRTTQNAGKQALLAKGEPELALGQSRFCVTLCEPADLYVPVRRGLAAGMGPGEGKSHADLFGAWAIGFDPLQSRRLGILPTIYFSPTDMFGEALGIGGIPGLNLQMIQRLKELRDLLILLAGIEADLEVTGGTLPPRDMIDSLGYDLPFEGRIVETIRSMPAERRKAVFELFNIDRSPALDLVSYVEMMMGLFQQTDSKIDGTPYAFYQQKEWRLIHHMRDGMIWYCLGPQPEFRDAYAWDRQPQIASLRRLIEELAGPRDEDYFSNCWLLEEVDGRPVSDHITMVIVPKRARHLAAHLLDRYAVPAQLVDAEEFGFDRA